MKTIVTAGLAGLLLSGAALTQGEWTYLRCDLETEYRAGREGETPRIVQLEQNFAFRFNTEDFQRFVPGPGQWVSLCVADEDWDEAACTIDGRRVASLQHSVREDRLENAFSINRMTGAITYRLRRERPGFWRHQDGEGACSVVSAEAAVSVSDRGDQP